MLLPPSRGQVARSSSSTPRTMANRDVATRAGGYSRSAPLATEYYERDYDYDEHLAHVAPLLRAQQEAAARVPVEKRAVLPPPLSPLLGEDDGDATGNAWEVFFREHSTARFFRERRYFPLAFPALNHANAILEIGAGAGAALLPVLRSNPYAERIVATDVSASSLAQLQRCAQEVLGKDEEAGDRRRAVGSRRPWSTAPRKPTPSSRPSSGR
jgi:hypothetical protein